MNIKKHVLGLTFTGDIDIILTAIQKVLYQ